MFVALPKGDEAKGWLDTTYLGQNVRCDLIHKRKVIDCKTAGAKRKGIFRARNQLRAVFHPSTLLRLLRFSAFFCDLTGFALVYRIR